MVLVSFFLVFVVSFVDRASCVSFSDLASVEHVCSKEEHSQQEQNIEVQNSRTRQMEPGSTEVTGRMGKVAGKSPEKVPQTDDYYAKQHDCFCQWP